MPSSQQPATIQSRDGTSQAGRLLPELDPGYAQVDERTTRDLLAFAKAYARELKYFGVDDPDRASGDWSGFIGPAIDLDVAADYVAEPERLSREDAAPYARPHVALLLVFLRLLEHARAQINAITRRHLEFYYRDVLRTVRKRAVPDKVHILVELDGATRELALPPGTALAAGKDRLDTDLVYRTDRELIANQVHVAQIRSLRVDKKITGIREASRRYLIDGTRTDAFVGMLRIALGQPNPGDPLPVNLTVKPPQYPGVPPANQSNPEVGFEALLQAQQLIGVVETGLAMPAYDDFRELMRWKRLRQDNDARDWKRINGFLEKAGKTRTRDPGFTFNPSNPSDFTGNLRSVLGLTPEAFATLFDGLPEIRSVEDAYAVYTERADVRAFIQPPSGPVNGVLPKSLYLALDDFKSMMQTKVLMDNQWDEINRLLEEAGQRKRQNADFALPPAARASRVFDEKFAAAGLDFKSGTFEFKGTLDAYYEAFLSVERYFYMSAESFMYLMSVAPRGDASVADEWAWEKAYEIVAAAHSEMIYARRRDVLLRAAQPGGAPVTDSVKALCAMLAVVLDEEISAEELRPRLDSLGLASKDLKYLVDIADKREPAPEWSVVATVLEIVQRNRQDFQEPVAENIEWRNLYPAADATAVTAHSTQPAAEALPRWKTFGRIDTAKDVIPPPSFGWAMASTLLALSEGRREIQLALGFSADPTHFDLVGIRTLLAPPASTPLVAGFNPFRVEVSTSKGWLEPASVKLSWANPDMGGYPAVHGADTSTLRMLVVSFTLAKDQPALTPLTRDVHGIDTSLPVLRLLMKPVWDDQAHCYVTSYQRLRMLVLVRLRLTVSVAGLENLFLRNDETVLNAKKPFEPFGISPAVGSRLYLGNREIVANALDSLRFNISWMGAPSSFADYYRNYPGNLGNKSFTARVALSDAGVLKDFSAPLPLFDGTDATKPVGTTLKPPIDQGNPATADADSADPSEWSRSLVLELKGPDLQHSAYPSVALKKSLDMAAAIANKTPPTLDPATYQVNPPYTPKIKSLSLDYSASVELALVQVATGTAGARLFHVQPFGYAEVMPEGVQPGCPFLPQFDFEGELYIGLSGVTAPQTVSLLFQVAEGSANPDLASEPVAWTYLSGNRWLTLHDGGLRADATRGLINSGIVELSLKPAKASTLLPAGLYWIRAAIARNPDSVCDMVATHTNAALATFADDNNAPDHLSTPLPPESIAGPVTPIPGVSRIRQPYTSFGGKMAEQDASFYVRVSERLRHKQRALTAWDYERLVLEKFPRLYKVKCLHADPVAHPREPGRIDLVVIPDIRNRLPFNPFEPKAPADLIRDVEAFLRDKTPPFAAVTVKNARYFPVKVRCGVRFMPGTDEGYCRRRLNEELTRFLSPWAYEEGADLVIGGSIYANSIINFIDGREYVDYVAEFKLFTSEDGETFNLIPPGDDYHATATTPDGVLVAAREHEFDVISEADYRAEDFTGINYMRIELDFIVG